jgi:hypothetical protein
MAIEPIGLVSPSLFSRLERCGLAEALSRQRTYGGAQPSRPPARLGTAAHQVLETLLKAILAGDKPQDLRAWVRGEWQSRTAAQQQSAARFDEERVLGPAEGWPGYYDIEARLTIEASRLAHDAATWSTETVHVEQWMEDDGLGLEGKPDLVVTEGGGRLVDFKSGRPTAADVQPGASYASQIAIYMALLRSHGTHVEEAFIQPLGLKALRVPISEHDEAVVAERARLMADQFNTAVADGRETDLASPGDEACGWCPHAASCPALWASLDAFTEMNSVEGEVMAVKQSARGLSVRIQAARGTRVGDVTVIQLRAVGPLADVGVGDLLRLAGLRATDEPEVLASSRAGWTRVLRLNGPLRLTPGDKLAKGSPSC